MSETARRITNVTRDEMHILIGSLPESERAERDLLRLSDRDREAVRRALRRLEADPGSVDITKLYGDEWRLRVGRWRVRFEMDNAAGILHIARVLPRKEAYRG